MKKFNFYNSGKCINTLRYNSSYNLRYFSMSRRRTQKIKLHFLHKLKLKLIFWSDDRWSCSLSICVTKDDNARETFFKVIKTVSCHYIHSDQRSFQWNYNRVYFLWIQFRWANLIQFSDIHLIVINFNRFEKLSLKALEEEKKIHWTVWVR